MNLFNDKVHNKYMFVEHEYVNMMAKSLYIQRFIFKNIPFYQNIMNDIMFDNILLPPFEPLILTKGIPM